MDINFKMKKSFLYGLILLVLACTSTVSAEIEFAPYYNYSFVEGASMSPAGDLGFLVALSNDIGVIVKPLERHSFIGFYSIKYQGPGLKRQEGREFSERYLDHLFVVRHHYYIDKITVLKSQFDVIMEKRRSGTNETWETGLYNFNRYGGSVGLEREISKDVSLAGTFKYHFMTFPNYTDMLEELRSGADPSASEGKQNNHIVELGGKVIYKKYNKVDFNISQQFYTKQKVAANTVQSNGSYYKQEKQRDLTVNVNISREQALSRISVLNPELTLIHKNSNQNYQHFAEVTSTAPVSFHSDYNDYIDISLAVPLTFALTPTGKWSLVLDPDFSYKIYLKREPRDEDGEFIEGKRQSRLLGIYTIGFRNQIGESSSSMMFFTYQKQTSNMEFEKYLPYNYSAFSLGIKFQMEY
jgi:hypothetical protein